MLRPVSLPVALVFCSVRRALRVSLVAAAFAPLVTAQVTTLASVSSDGTAANQQSDYPSLSPDGRFVAFRSRGTNLVPGDVNGRDDVFLRDLATGTTTLVSVDLSGVPGDGHSAYPSVSLHGRYVAFASGASHLVPFDTATGSDVFVRDVQAGTTTCASVAIGGGVGNDSSSGRCSISADGRFVAFGSWASDLVLGDTNAMFDIFVRDVQAGTTTCATIGLSGTTANDTSSDPEISADGCRVAFDSQASDLVSGDLNGAIDVFVRDLVTGAIDLVSRSSSGAIGNDHSSFASISADGRFVTFSSLASNLVPGDTNGVGDIFVRDLQAGTTTRVSVSSSGVQGSKSSDLSSISADGCVIAFRSNATNLVPDDFNGKYDIFVHDVPSGTTTRVSVTSQGAEANGNSIYPVVSGNARMIAFESEATLTPNDASFAKSVYVHDRLGLGLRSLCEPGADGVVDCPCLNPPLGPDRGCDNSSLTGGAKLSATGFADVGLDSLVLHSSGQKPASTSIVLQGTAALATGTVFGQGVRCAGGTLTRLYVGAADGGGYTAPAAGEPSVSARSAACGDPITSGETRYYLVYYRDPIVPGGCPPVSTFNATQTGEVVWRF